MLSSDGLDNVTELESNRRAKLGLLAGVASGICFGLMNFLVHVAAGHIPSTELMMVRSLLAVLLFLPSVWKRPISLVKKRAVTLWLRGLAGAISILCLAWNLQHTSVGLANSIFNFTPVGIVLLGWLFPAVSVAIVRIPYVVLISIASLIFWSGSTYTSSISIWVVGFSGMAAAAICYFMTKLIAKDWNGLQSTWALSLATLPVCFALKHGPWVAFSLHNGLLMIAVGMLGVLGQVLVTWSFEYADLSVAAALVPSTIIWGVLLDMIFKGFPKVQGWIGCGIYLLVTMLLILQGRRSTLPSKEVLARRQAH